MTDISREDGRERPDIVERLRQTYFPDPLTDEAAAEIERLRAALQEITQIEKGYEAVEIARRALEPKP